MVIWLMPLTFCVPETPVAGRVRLPAPSSLRVTASSALLPVIVRRGPETVNVTAGRLRSSSRSRQRRTERVRGAAWTFIVQLLLGAEGEGAHPGCRGEALTQL